MNHHHNRRTSVLGSVAIASLGLLFSGFCPQLSAAPFARTFRFCQPNGTVITLWGQGDEFSAIFETLDGFTVVFDPQSRAYCYAEVSPGNGSLGSTGVIVGQASPTDLGLEPHVRPSRAFALQSAQANFVRWDALTRTSERWTELKAARAQEGTTLSAPPNFKTLGPKCGITFLIDFEDERGTFTREEVEAFLNADTYTGFGNNGSVKQYFSDVSNGRLVFTNVVTPYITIPNSVRPRRYYNDPTKDCFQQCQYLIRDALAVMKKLPNFTNDFLPLFEGVTASANRKITSAAFFVAGMSSGVWAKGIWGQASSLTYYADAVLLSPGGKIVDLYQLSEMEDRLTLATFCHETGHLLCGYPDLYDYDSDTSSGAGCFCIMGSGRRWDFNPPQVCAYLKAASGWADVVDLRSGTNFLASLSASGADFNRLYRWRNPSVPTEYFLAENRQKTGRDAEIPGGGIAIYHIDELGSRDDQSLLPNSTHLNYEVSLEQADNQSDLQYNHNIGDPRDLFYSENPAPGYANAFSDFTSPSARWWSGIRSGLSFSDFSTNGSTITFQARVDPVLFRLDPQDLTVIQGQPASFTFSMAPTATNITIEWCKDGAPLPASSNITGANARLLKIAAANVTDTGDYQALVKDNAGVHATRAARLTVLPSSFLSTSYGSGTVSLLPDGADLTSATEGFGARADAFKFLGRAIPGDFDARVRVLGISAKSTTTRAGLTVRKALTVSDAHVSVLSGFTTELRHGGVRCTVLSRPIYLGYNRELTSTLVPYGPPTYTDFSPAESWLRLKREGNRFTCYRSVNGTDWVWLHSLECELGDEPCVGLVLAGGPDNTGASSASFRNYEIVTNSPTTIALGNPDGVAQEGSLDDACVVVRASRNGPLTVGITYAGEAQPGKDFIADPAVYIPPGTNAGILPLRAINDTEPSDPKRVEVSLASQPESVAVQPHTATVLILDDEQVRGGLNLRVYPDLDGSAVQEVARQFTNELAVTTDLSRTEFESDLATNQFRFGEVFSGYLVPPETGDYVFYLAADDTAELWLSTDSDPANLRRVASVPGYTVFRKYSGSGNHSPSIPLEQGVYYCLRAFHKQRTETTSFSVAWQLPGGPPPPDGSEPIAGQFLAYRLPLAPSVQLNFPNGECYNLTCATAGANTCVLEISNDLANWLPVRTNQLPARLATDSIETPPGYATIRFYRAVMR